MSLDIFFQGFAGGDAAPADGAAALRALGPLVGNNGFAEVRTADGSAYVYGEDDPDSGLMINHAAGRAIWDLLYEMARAAGYVVMPIGCPICVVDAADIAELPEELQNDTEVISSGAELLAVIRSS